MIEGEIISKLKQNVGEQCVFETSVPRAQRIFMRVKKECFKDVILFLKNEGFVHLSAITGLEANRDAIELLYHLDREGILLTVRVKLQMNENSLPTITDVMPGSSLYEREIHDLFGVKFEGHPDLKRLILPDEWPEGVHPLRKHQTIEGTQKELRNRQKKSHGKK